MQHGVQFLEWPFFDEAHRRLGREAAAWARGALGHWTHDPDADAVCRRLVREMGEAGWLRYSVPPGGADATSIDVRSICLLREVFGYHSGLADFAFAMQGLGSGSIALAGSEALRAKYLPKVSRGESIAAFALSEPDSGSDVAAIATTARRDGEHYVLNGTKTWISNGGIADFYVIFVRTGEAPGTRGLSAFVLDAGTPGLDERERIDIISPHPMATLKLTDCRVAAANLLGSPGEGFKIAMRNLDIFRTSVGAAALGLARRDGEHYVMNGTKTWISNGGIADFYVIFVRTGEAPGTRGLSAFVLEAGTPGLDERSRIDIISPHPMATLKLSDCRVPAANLLGAPGEGFKIAMRNLDIFRTSVGAAALGLARRALQEALGHARARRMFGKVLADFQITQAKLADMATAIDAAALLVYRAAWTRDVAKRAVTREAAMAKMNATESAQVVIDSAVQMFGGLGVVSGHPVERLYREIRSLRIYEGATEVQKLIISRELLQAFARESELP